MAIALHDVRFSNRPVMGWTRRAPASRSRKPAWGCENQEHPMPRVTSSSNIIATIGIDIGKNTFHVIGLDDKGAIILRHKLSRGQVYARLANIPPCLIGMEACVGAHHLGRQRSKRLMTVPGIGPIISTATVAAIGTGEVFSKGRDFGAWLGLVPKQISTGDRTILGGISK